MPKTLKSQELKAKQQKKLEENGGKFINKQGYYIFLENNFIFSQKCETHKTPE